MERFPTWQLWCALHTYPMRDIRLRLRVLRVRPRESKLVRLHGVWVWVTLNLVAAGVLLRAPKPTPMSIETFLWLLSLLMGAFITVDGLRAALKVNASIFKLHGQRNYDLFALLPAGELTGILNICRTHRVPIDYPIRGVTRLLVGLALAVGVYLLSLTSDQSYVQAFGAIIAGAAWWVLYMGLMRCVDYVQSFVCAMLVTMLTSQQRSRVDAQMWLIGTFVGIQVVFYGGLLPLLLHAMFYARPVDSRRFRFDELDFVWVVMLVPLIFALCRELLNLILWRLVQRRMET